MSIIYALVAKEKTKILAEYTDYSGNFEQMILKLLNKVTENHRATFAYNNQYFFHYINSENNITFMCMRDKKYKSECAFAFLEDIKQSFLKAFSLQEIQEAIPHGLNSRFKHVIKSKIEFSRNNENYDNLANLKSALYEVKNDIMETDDFLNERNEKINIIVQKADLLKSDSSTYYNWVNKNFESSKKILIRLFPLLI